MRRRGFFAIDGIPGVGKSAAAHQVAIESGGVVLSLPESFRRFRADADLDRSAEPLVRLTYYVAAIAHLAAEAEAVEEGVAIADRYLPSVLGIFEAEGSLPVRTIDAVSAPVRALLPVPLMSVVLTADASVIRGRSEQRAKPPLHSTPIHDRAASDPEFAERWQRSIIRWSASMGPHVVIDTSAMSAHEVAAAVGDAYDIRPSREHHDR